MDDITIEDLRDGDGSVRWDRGGQAFGGTLPYDPDLPVLSGDRSRAAYFGDDLVAGVNVIDFAVQFRGRSIPCGGVSGVFVQPEARGRGLARRMIDDALVHMIERGEIVSALYPTTATLYRSMGYEIAGEYVVRRVPIADVSAPTVPRRWERLDFHDPAIRALADRTAPTHDFGLLLGDNFWARHPHAWSTAKNVQRFAYAGRVDGDDPDVVVVYRYVDDGPSWLYDIDLELIAAPTADGLRAGFSFLAGHSTTATEIRTRATAAQIAAAVPQAQRVSVVESIPPMFRIVDLPAAIEARGAPTGLQGSVAVDVVDDVLPSNAGKWTITVEGGEARAKRGGAGEIALTVQQLSALFTGWAAPHNLAATGAIAASRADCDLLAALFAGTPACTVFF